MKSLFKKFEKERNDRKKKTLFTEEKWINKVRATLWGFGAQFISVLIPIFQLKVVRRLVVCHEKKKEKLNIIRL